MAFDEAKIGILAISKPIFLVILKEVKDLKLLKIRDSSLRAE
jgi:hypothetical protein